MRTVSDAAAVRLYHLGDDGVAATLLYGPLAEALALAAAQPEEIADGLFLQTADDVVAYRDFVEG